MAERPELLVFDGSVLRCDGHEWQPQRDLYAVLGHPVDHSRSPVFHNAVYAAVGIDADYVRIDVEPEHLETLVTAAADLGLCGGNVTVPLKEDIAALCRTLSGEAQRLGAVNTFRVESDAWAGHNTDLGGLCEELAIGGVGAGWTGMVLGAGGSARAAVCALLDLGLENVVVAARAGPGTERTAAWLAADKDLNARVSLAPWRQLSTGLAQSLVVVGCVPFGVDTHAVLPPASTSRHALYYDLRYGDHAPPSPPAWESRDGLGLLLAQGALSFTWLFGIDAPRDVMADALQHD